ncbi:MAG: damage-control phosphatase ARMT1 family protein [Anaerolineae bacterium]|nr:damage-control phosphatase ARMT1 family protein [Anaerolineae bacterium]
MVEPSGVQPVPPPLMTSEPGSFAEATIVRRKPQIIEGVLRDNEYPPEIQEALRALADEVLTGEIQPLAEPTPDRAEWDAQWCPYAGLTWRNVPWYFAEAFFYRRLLEAVRYFQPGIWQGHDPFEVQKRRQIDGPGGAVPLAAQLVALLPKDPVEAGRALIYASLWGNRVDLSNREVLAEAALEAGHPEDVLIDDSAEILDFLTGEPHGLIDFVNDNAGPEAAFDLLLADLILEQGWAQRVRMHLKPYPFFVSDAMVKDVRELVTRLEGAVETRDAGDRLAGWVEAGTLELRDHPFWTSARAFHEMPDDLRCDLAAADLVILKGDANYRRLLGDRHWPFTASLEEITAYFPAPYAVLRTLKAEILVGLAESQLQLLRSAEADWLINGRRGLVQLVTPQARESRPS